MRKVNISIYRRLVQPDFLTNEKEMFQKLVRLTSKEKVCSNIWVEI